MKGIGYTVGNTKYESNTLLLYVSQETLTSSEPYFAHFHRNILKYKKRGNAYN